MTTADDNTEMPRTPSEQQHKKEEDDEVKGGEDHADNDDEEDDALSYDPGETPMGTSSPKY